MGNLTLFTAGTANMLKKQAVDRARKGVERTRRNLTVPPTPSFWLELIEEDPDNPGRYSWKKVTTVDGELTDTDPLIDSAGLYTARDINGHSGLPEGTRVEVKFAGYDSTADNEPVYLFCFDRAPGTMIRVNLTKDGGSNGNKTTAATWTYTATSLDGVELGTGLAPEWPRENGMFTAATLGEGYYGVDGAFVLYRAAEEPDTTGCP